MRAGRDVALALFDVVHLDMVLMFGARWIWREFWIGFGWAMLLGAAFAGPVAAIMTDTGWPWFTLFLLVFFV